MFIIYGNIISSFVVLLSSDYMYVHTIENDFLKGINITSIFAIWARLIRKHAFIFLTILIDSFIIFTIITRIMNLRNVVKGVGAIHLRSSLFVQSDRPKSIKEFLSETDGQPKHIMRNFQLLDHLITSYTVSKKIAMLV